jgi:sugar/nucleoside kinase (ribokinase family)
MQIVPLQPVDYLAVGHISVDISPQGQALGGTVAYAALTAQALGLRAGIVTSWGAELSPGALANIPIVSFPSSTSTTFENIQTPEGRVQEIHHVAPTIHLNVVPDVWRNAPIVHLGPIAQEVDPSLVRSFSEGLIGVTPQGWLRGWNSSKRVRITEWPEASFVLQRAGAAVISVEDVGGDENRIDEMAAACRVLAVTEGDQGARLYWNGDVRRFRPPQVSIIDTTGAGDVFAAAFFVRMYTTRDPWEAARFATLLASYSVTRSGFDSIPTPEEIKESMVEVF